MDKIREQIEWKRRRLATTSMPTDARMKEDALVDTMERLLAENELLKAEHEAGRHICRTTSNAVWGLWVTAADAAHDAIVAVEADEDK
jgi:hypothetical protein